MEETIKRAILKHALQNATSYKGKANEGSVLGKILAEFPELKSQVKELVADIRIIVTDVNKLSLNEQETKLEGFKDELKTKEHTKKELPELPDMQERVVMRFAPNPNGPLSIGHARPALLNWFYVKEYGGKFILRFDDTDPKVKMPLKEAYKWILNDLKWLGIKPNKIVRQSARLKIYYSYAEELIKLDKAYVCTCQIETKRKLLKEKKSCLCRDLNADEQLKRWKKMFDGFKEGQAVLRIKTDLEHKNPAIRDWPAFRIVSKPKHPFSKAHVWPLLNFASAIDDHELNVTCIIRGVDLEIAEYRQKYIYDYFGWDYPKTLLNGKLLVAGIRSTSQASKLIKAKKLNGWDDPRLGTLMALRRRGFQADAVVEFIKELGLNKAGIQVSMENLSACNKKLVEKSNRYFFVWDPKAITIENAPKMFIKLQSHPDCKERSFRRFTTTQKFFVSDKIEKGKIYRLIGLFNFKDKRFISQDHKIELNAILIHWLPADKKQYLHAEIVMTDNSVRKGLVEKNISKVKIGDVVQFQRFGFCRLDSKGKTYRFYFGHR